MGRILSFSADISKTCNYLKWVQRSFYLTTANGDTSGEILMVNQRNYRDTIAER